MTQQIQAQHEPDRRRFLRKHWAAFAVLTVAAIIAAVGAGNVLVWFTGNAQATGLVPATLQLWYIYDALVFVVYALLWELAVIGIPVAFVAIGAWQWWEHLPMEERRQFSFNGKGKQNSKAASFGCQLKFV